MAKYDKAIRVSGDVKETAEESKLEDETWDEFVLRCHEEGPKVQRLVDADEVVDELADTLAGKVADEVEDRVDTINSDDVRAATEAGVESAMSNAR